MTKRALDTEAAAERASGNPGGDSVSPAQSTGSQSTLDTLWMTERDDPRNVLHPKHVTQQPRVFSSTSLESIATRLPQLVLLPEDGGAPSGDLVLGPLLGEGSMGRVYQASQTSLHREVAVKTIAPDKDPRKMTEMLLRETWVTGWLEHPNIVPVHLLGVDPDGQPILVMKQIEGVLWSELIQDEELLADYLEEEESALEWHIRTLLQVCHAIEFAHSRGIIHRDLKPANIMLGSFGEVYVLDWGLALQVEVRGPHKTRPPFPTTAESQGIAGTPSYMAPEMAVGDGSKLSYATDIYLLGAMLHEAIVGTPPHKGSTLSHILRCAQESEPYVYPEETPQELREICLRAMAANPDDRFSEIKALRRALQSFLQHQESYRLSHNTLAPLDALCANSAALPEMHTQAPSQVYERFGRCHFSLQRALELWPENSEASHSLQRLLEWMIQFEITQGHVDTAARWLSELPTENPACVALLDAARAKQADAKARLQRLQHIQDEVDLSSSRELRRKAAMAMAFVWFLVSTLGCSLAITEMIKPDHVHLLICNLVFAFAIGVTVLIGREVLLNNHANRQIVLLFVLFCSMILLTRLVFMSLQIDFQKSIILEYITFIHFVGMMSVLYNKRILLAAALYLLAVISSFFASANGVYVIIAITHPTCLVIVSWFWTEHDHQSAAQPNQSVTRQAP